MNKMKLSKMLLISASLVFIALFIGSTTCSALTTHTVECPTYVKLGEEFTINIVFDYELDCNCLFGIYVWLYSMVNDEVTNSWTIGSQRYILNLENYPRPTNVSWTLDTLIFAFGSLETNDTIKFRIKYKTGYDTGSIVQFEGMIVTDTYYIIIGEEPNGTNNATFTIPVLILSAIVIFIRKKKVDPHA